MQLFKSGIDLHEQVLAFIKNAKNLHIFVPYIKLEALEALLDDTDCCKAIFVRWEPRDLIIGASDLEIYPFCKKRGISLFRNSRLHLKAFIENYQTCLIGSANISQRALNFPASSFYNYELLTNVDNLTIDDRLYFNIIEQESLLITDYIYDQLLKQMPAKKVAFPEETDFDIVIETPIKEFLISSLPLSNSVDTLLRIYETKSFIHDVELNCATHDLALYRINFGLPLNYFLEELKRAFFNHPFIIAFLNEVNKRGEIYFGESKIWIHQNCSNVPLPRRWEITENIQILFRWITRLSDGLYDVDRPNHSERLFRKLES